MPFWISTSHKRKLWKGTSNDNSCSKNWFQSSHKIIYKKQKNKNTIFIKGHIEHSYHVPILSHMWFLRRYINFSQYKSMIEWIEKPLCFENNSSSIYAKFGSNCSKDFWEKAEMWKANGHKVTTIPHIDLWYRYAKNMLQWTCARSHVAYYVFRAIKCAKSKR